MQLSKLIPTLVLTTTLIFPTIKTGAFTLSELLNLSNSEAQMISLDLPDAPSDGNITTGTVGGGRRAPDNRCTDSTQAPLTVLMSRQVNHIESLDSDAQNSNLSVYWYLPETKALRAEFLILGNNTQFVYFQEFEIPQNKKGLVRLDLPNNLNLQENNVYKWELALVCQEFDRSSDEYVWGAIEPLNNNQESQLNNELESARNNPSQENASSIEEAMANVYIRHNLWHKVLSLFLANSNNNENAEYLTELFDYFGLDPQTNLIGVVDENGFKEIQ